MPCLLLRPRSRSDLFRWPRCPSLGLCTRDSLVFRLMNVPSIRTGLSFAVGFKRPRRTTRVTRVTSPSRPMLDCPCRRPTANSKRTTIPTSCVLPRRRRSKWRRAGQAHPHYRTTRALASSNRRMPSHAFKPRAYATPLVVGLIRNRGPAAAASLNVVIPAATAFRQATQDITVLPFQTTEENRMKRVLSRRRKRRRVGQACQVCRAMRAATNTSWPTPSYPRSHPPAGSGPTPDHPCNRPVVVDGDAVAILTTRRTALPLWEVTPSRARMRMSSGPNEGSAAG